MKERPILFSAPMVRAILAGNKTQTRRIFTAKNGGVWPHKNDLPGMRQVLRNCPYGQPGDELWVRETWQGPLLEDGDQWDMFRNDGPDEFKKSEFCVYRATDTLDAVDGDGKELGWRPSIHMPRWASRIQLEITAVRVERLRDINEADAIAEGLFRDQAGRWTTYSATIEAREHLNPVEAYRDLWESINGAGSWDENPWVWVVEFKRAGGAA